MLGSVSARLLATPLILGSGSATRQAILREIGFTTFDIVKPDIDEKAIRFEEPAELVQ